MSFPDLPAVLITGASKGIGRACADRLAGAGFRVFAGVRGEADAEALRSERVIPVTLDVTRSDDVSRAARQIGERVGAAGLRGVVNNAGIVVAGPLEGVPLDDLRHQLEVNVVGVVAVTQAMLPLLRAGEGRIVNISSINGRVTAPFSAAYAASKHALEAVSDGLRMELSRWRLPVSVIQPGAVDTPIWETSGQRAAEIAERVPADVRERYARVYERLQGTLQPPDHAVAPAAVARRVEHALTARRPRTRYLVGRDARIAALARFLLPDRWLDRVIMGRRSRR